jgi:hypothetical protein
LIDGVAKDVGARFHVEIVAKPGHRLVRP